MYDPSTNKLHRLTFSRSLAQHLTGVTGLKLGRWRYRVGRELEVGERSKSGLYALVDRKSDVTLRISLDPEIAKLHTDGETRYLREAWLNGLL